MITKNLLWNARRFGAEDGLWRRRRPAQRVRQRTLERKASNDFARNGLFTFLMGWTEAIQGENRNVVLEGKKKIHSIYCSLSKCDGELLALLACRMNGQRIVRLRVMGHGIVIANKAYLMFAFAKGRVGPRRPVCPGRHCAAAETEKSWRRTSPLPFQRHIPAPPASANGKPAPPRPGLPGPGPNGGDSGVAVAAMSGAEGRMASPPFPRRSFDLRAPAKPEGKTLRHRSQRPSRNEYITVNVEDEVEAVIIENSENEDLENGLSASGMLAIEPNSQGSGNNHHYISQLSYGSEGLPVVSDQGVSNPSAGQRDAGEMEFIFLHKRHRLASSQGNSTNFLQLFSQIMI
ncbi:uncharacterized protein LOC119937565 [Tachyglossus aculeatus]|uniref:uncharacterized protein LOC119937565 n=1 Tax=Tachyglossus aculeatus TaxID=9261 RepID=UPI0018F48488|nr:uncharacterized protein LOC119937565 [Tachyglossus aculeatus]